MSTTPPPQPQFGVINERDQIISFCLQACDNYKLQIQNLQTVNTGLQKNLAELQAKLAVYEAPPSETKPEEPPKASPAVN